MAKAATVEKDSEPIERARARVADLARAEVDRYRQLAPKRRELFEAQQAKEFKTAAMLREEVEYLEDTESGRRERRAAIRELHLLQAQALEAKATALDAEYEERRARAWMLYERREDPEHVEYQRELETLEQLRSEARAWRVRAKLLRRDRDPVVDYGTVTGQNPDDLIAGLMRIPEVLGPPVASVYELAKKRERLGRRGQYLQMSWLRSRIQELEWNGVIIPDDQPLRPLGSN